MKDRALGRKAKEFLCEIQKMDRMIQRLCDTAATLRTHLTGQCYGHKPDKVQGTAPGDTIAATMAKIIDLEREIDQHIDALVKRKREAIHLISQLPDYNQQNVLMARYVQGMPWEEIARELDREIRWVYRVHGKGLAAFASVNVSKSQ